MLTYSLDKKGAIPLYEQLYRAIKKDITNWDFKSWRKITIKTLPCQTPWHIYRYG